MQSTGWIFGKFDPGVEYRTKPGDEEVVQRRKKLTYVRFRNHFGSITFNNAEGTISPANDLESTNGGVTAKPSGTSKMIMSDHSLDQEGGQGSAMWRETEVWEAYTDWTDWTTIETDLGITNPF